MNFDQKLYPALAWAIMATLSLAVCSRKMCAQTNDISPQQPIPAMVGVNNSAIPPETYNADRNGDRMMTPPPVSGQTYPITLGSQERSNYLRSGVSFTSAYTDNVLGGATPLSDISYSVTPLIALDETTTRMHLVLDYAPGFTFYQRTSSRNQADHNAFIDFAYRFSPHVTFSAHDEFQKTSNVFNQSADFSRGVVSGGVQVPNFSIIVPVADQLNNFSNVGISYQFALNDMVGASGTFSHLHYPNEAQVPGLADSSSQGGLAFYSHRLGSEQYIGVTYTFQRLMAYPTMGQNETQTQAVLLFYTVAPTSSKLTISFFGGPQYSDTTLPAPNVPLMSWSGSGGGSLGWQEKSTSFALSYAHIISAGGGLGGAVNQDIGSLSVRQRLTRTLTGSVSGGYAQNNIIGNVLLGVSNGHSMSGSAFLQQMIGEHVSVQLGYTRVHQSYNDISLISSTPNTNRESISISYQFSKPLGR